MEALVASLIGALVAAAVYLMLRRRTFALVLGSTMMTYAVNLFLVSTGRLVVNMPPVLGGHVPGQTDYTDPLPQALVLTAIVISFGMTAVTVMMAIGAFIEAGNDRVDMPRADRFGPFDDVGGEAPPIDEVGSGHPAEAAQIKEGSPQ